MRVLKYSPVPSTKTDYDIDQRLQQLAQLAKDLKTEVENLQAELSRNRPQPGPIDLEKDGIDLYVEIERYEVELIKHALRQCNGNQSRAAKLLRLKPSTLNAKLKHYRLQPVRSITLQRPEVQLPG